MTDKADRLYEKVLVLRFQAGDDRAFAGLIDRYHRRLRYYLRRLLDDPDRADDLLQDVWLTVFRRLSGLKNPGALSVWLYRIARNKALAELRTLQVHSELTVEPEAPESLAEEPEFSPEDAARIHACLDRLPHQHKEVLVLRFLEGMSYEGIAAVLRRPVGTVRSRLYYAKRALRREMES